MWIDCDVLQAEMRNLRRGYHLLVLASRCLAQMAEKKRLIAADRSWSQAVCAGVLKGEPVSFEITRDKIVTVDFNLVATEER